MTNLLKLLISVTIGYTHNSLSGDKVKTKFTECIENYRVLKCPLELMNCYVDEETVQ